MAQNFLSCDRDQELLLAPNMRDWLPEDHLVWFVIASVEALHRRRQWMIEPVFADIKVNRRAGRSDAEVSGRCAPNGASSPPPTTC
jgi:hypothetical protein